TPRHPCYPLLPYTTLFRSARYLAAAGRPAEAETEYELALAAPDGTQQERAVAAAYCAELLLQLGRYADAGVRAREALDLARTVRSEEHTSELQSLAYLVCR